MDDPNGVVVLQEVVNALPAGSVRPSAVHEDYGGPGSILRVCAHGLLLSDPLFPVGVNLSTGCMVPPSALWRELRRIPRMRTSPKRSSRKLVLEVRRSGEKIGG